MLIALPASAITTEEASKINTYAIIAYCLDAASQCVSKLSTYAIVQPITDSAVATKINVYAIIQPCSVTPTAPACVSHGGLFRGFP